MKILDKIKISFFLTGILISFIVSLSFFYFSGLETEWFTGSKEIRSTGLVTFAELRLIFISLVIFIPVFSWLTGALLARFSISSFSRLFRKSKAIAEGRRDNLDKIPDKDEAGRISSVFDSLLEKIKSLEDSLRVMNAEIIKLNKKESFLEFELRKKEYFFDRTPYLILELDESLKIIWANKTARKVESDLLGRLCYQVFMGRETPCPECPALKAKETGIYYRGVISRFPVKNRGKESYWEVISIPVKERRSKISTIFNIACDITEYRKQKEQILKDENYFKDIVQRGQDIIFITDKEGKIKFISRAIKDILGYEPEEIVGNKLSLFLISSDSTGLNQSFRNTLSGKQPPVVFTEALSKQNNTLFVEVHFIPVIREGEVFEVQGVVRDITKREQEGEVLRNIVKDFRERLKKLDCFYGLSKLLENPRVSLDVLFQGVVGLIPPAWEYPEVACSRIVYEDKEWRSNNFEVTPWRQTCDIIIGEKKKGLIEVYYLEKRPDLFEGPFSREERYLINAVAERLRKTIEKKIADEEIIKFKAIADKANYGTAIIDTEGKFTYVNEAFAAMHKYEKKELLSENISLLYPGGEHRRVGILRKILESSESFSSAELYNKRKDGSVFPVFTTAAVIYNEKGKPLLISLIVADITERKKAEEELRAAYNKLKETQAQLIHAGKMEIIGRLASGVAHEVKNPLAIMIQGIEYLEKRIKSDDKNIALTINYLKDSVERADDIIRGLLDLSSLSKMNIEKEDLNAVIERSLFLMNYQLDKSRIKVIKDLDSDIPYIDIDKNRLEQVFVNLFWNAIQAISGKGELRVKTYVKKLSGDDIAKYADKEFFTFSQQEVVVVEIEDTGPGIPQKIIRKIYEPFFTTKPKGKGTGLGLSIVKNIIEIHKGFIDIRNKEEEGGAIVTMMFRL
ncbi:MAG: PAS domain S-box protein [Candidatus Omnitrophica bacterium]|nr:PAS domain S-box protein [Candidatus Omnitrophota bacterium]MBD3268736.1 PAS domain S-box protein [Candidatus Omnitrophota bacterium]